ncbi:hypothetical protein [Paenibacillus favisporus]|uniref:hypothetical protein n=1 Tax=Paenibacillus favisporus TaxID=221028 RepID=UPI003D2668E8
MTHTEPAAEGKWAMVYFIMGIAVFLAGGLIATWVFGPWGTVLTLLVMVGMLSYLYGMVEDLRARVSFLERKLGVSEEDDYQMSDEDIEAELERELDTESGSADEAEKGRNPTQREE